ncbi:MAG: DUF4157 domain-containing protein [bacterium]
MGANRSPRSPASSERSTSSSAKTAFPANVPLAQQLGNGQLQRLLRARAIQAKLTISQPHDAFEQEADRVADQVLRIPAEGVSSPPVQHRTIERDEDTLQRHHDAASEVPTVTVATEHAIQSLSQRGNALPDGVRSFMEPRFDRDFSGVRVHTDSHANDLAGSVHAQAFTVGRNIVFGAGHYAPHTDRGRRLLAHELTHVVQQSPDAVGRPPRIQRQAAPATANATAINASTLGAPAAREESANRVAFVREAGLKLHADPHPNSRILEQMPFGQRVHTVNGSVPQDGWLEIVVQGRTGFVNAQRLHFPPPQLIEKDPALRLVRVSHHLSFWALVKDMYGIEGDESTKDQNMNHFINAIRAVNKPEAFTVKQGLLDKIGNFALTGRDAKDTFLKENVDLWIPSFGIAAKMDVGSGTVRGEIKRFVKKVEQKLSDFKEAASRSSAYMPKAVASRAGEASLGILEGVLEFAKDAVKILAASTAVGALIGALFGGVGAAPGAEVGFEMGLLILDYYGLYMLVQAVLGIATTLVSQLANFIKLVWNADGNPKQLDLAAQSLADVIGTLVNAVLVVVAAYLLKKGSKALAKTRFGRTIGESRLAKWLEDRQKGKAQLQEAAVTKVRQLVKGKEVRQLTAGQPDAADAVPQHVDHEGGVLERTEHSQGQEGDAIPQPIPHEDGIRENHPTPPARTRANTAKDPAAPDREVVDEEAKTPVRGTARPPRDPAAPDREVVDEEALTGQHENAGSRQAEPPRPQVRVGGFKRDAEWVSPPLNPQRLKVGGFARAAERVAPEGVTPRVPVKGFRPAARPINPIDADIPAEGDFVIRVERDPVTGEPRPSLPRRFPRTGDLAVGGFTAEPTSVPLGPESPRVKVRGFGRAADAPATSTIIGPVPTASPGSITLEVPTGVPKALPTDITFPLTVEPRRLRVGGFAGEPEQVPNPGVPPVKVGGFGRASEREAGIDVADGVPGAPRGPAEDTQRRQQPIQVDVPVVVPDSTPKLATDTTTHPGAHPAANVPESVPEIVDDHTDTTRPHRDPQTAGSNARIEHIGEYRFLNANEWNGAELHRRIGAFEHIGGPTSRIGPFVQFFQELIARARLDGAKVLRITGEFGGNDNVGKLRNFAARFGGTIRQVNPATVEFVIPLAD